MAAACSSSTSRDASGPSRSSDTTAAPAGSRRGGTVNRCSARSPWRRDRGVTRRGPEYSRPQIRDPAKRTSLRRGGLAPSIGRDHRSRGRLACAAEGCRGAPAPARSLHVRDQEVSGIHGILWYVFGSAISGTHVGWIADRWSWRGVFVTMVVCCVMTVACCAFTLSHKADTRAPTVAVAARGRFGIT